MIVTPGATSAPSSAHSFLLDPNDLVIGFDNLEDEGFPEIEDRIEEVNRVAMIDFTRGRALLLLLLLLLLAMHRIDVLIDDPAVSEGRSSLVQDRIDMMDVQ